MRRNANGLNGLVSDEPLSKRQRKAPVWASAYERGKRGAEDEEQHEERRDEVVVPGSPSAAPSTDGEDLPHQLATVVEHSFPTPDQLEVVMILEDGTRCRGVLSRAALPYGVGIPTQVRCDECAFSECMCTCAEPRMDIARAGQRR